MGIPFGVSLFCGGRGCVPFGWSGLLRGLGAQRPVGRLPGGGPRFSRETGGKRARGESFSPLDSLLWFGGPWGSPPSFFAWPAAYFPYARNGPPPSWAGWERQEFWDPLRWAPKIGGCTPNRASKAGTLGVRRVFCPARVRAKNRLDFIPALARAGSLRRWVLLYPKPSPWGKPLGRAILHKKSAPNQGTYMGCEIDATSPRCAPPRQNQRVGTSGP